MSFAEPRRLDELATLYRLEPTLRDVYVEGSTDRRFIEWYLHQSEVRGVTVSEINLVEIPPGLLHQAGLGDGNRSRVIVLARELERILGSETVSLSCLADTDFDGLLGQKHACALLLTTDYTCLEMYFYEARCMNKFLRLVVYGFPKSAKNVLAELQNPLQELFLIRMANHVLGWNLKLTQFEKLCELTGAGVAFDQAEYVKRILAANRRATHAKKFYEQIEKCRLLLTKESRKQVQGHDFVGLLAWYIRAHGKSKITQDLLERSLPACSECAWISEQPMFEELLKRLRS
jgi:hypothetical protein